MDQGNDDARARVTDGVTERDGTTVDVDLGGVELVDLLGDADDDGEGLVDLEEGDVGNGEVGLFESLGQSDGGCLGEVDGLNTGIGPS
jgi:hypothetical protein